MALVLCLPGRLGQRLERRAAQCADSVGELSSSGPNASHTNQPASSQDSSRLGWGGASL